MESRLVHSEVHVRKPVLLPVNNEHGVSTVVSDKIFLCHVLERQNVGNCFLVEPTNIA